MISSSLYSYNLEIDLPFTFPSSRPAACVVLHKLPMAAPREEITCLVSHCSSHDKSSLQAGRRRFGFTFLPGNETHKPGYSGADLARMWPEYRSTIVASNQLARSPNRNAGIGSISPSLYWKRQIPTAIVLFP